MSTTGKPKKHCAYLYLLFGFFFLLFSNGRWTVPLAAFLAPIFLVRFLRYNRPFKGFLFLILTGFVSNILVWKGLMPVPGLLYYIMTFMMALFSALVYLIDRISSQRLKGFLSTLVLPSAFVAMDYISVITNPGGSFGAIATTQNSLPLLQLLSLTGMWGITFVIYWTASVVNWILDRNLAKESLRKAFFACLIPLVFLIFYGQILLSQNNGKETVKIASVNIGRENIRNVFSGYPDQANEEINDNFLENCRIASRSQAKIVFGNEMMLNVSSENEENFLEKAKAVAIQNSLYIGLPLLVYPEEQAGTYPVNKITWISPDGEIVLSTNKAKPTPGEGDYGDAIIRVFESPYGNISSVICFDMDFPVLMKQAGRLGVDIMLVPGNDWKAITPYHTFVSSFRGMEQGFNLVRSASRGLSAAFDAKGRLLASQNYFQTDDSLFFADVPVRGRKTLYSVIGDLFAWLCIIYFSGISLYLLIRRINNYL